MKLKNISISSKIYLALILTFSLLASINVFLPQGAFIDQLANQYGLPAPKSIIALANFFIALIVYGALGLIGIKLTKKLKFPQIWSKNVSTKQKLLHPASVGISIGFFFIIADLIFSQFHSLGTLPHPPFPTSIVVTITASIGEEIIFRLFFISFWVWLISHVIFKKKYQHQIFWPIAILSAFAFAFGHIPSMKLVFGYESFNQIPSILLLEIFMLNGALSLLAAGYFRKYGILAAMGIHFWADIIWHVFSSLIN